MNKAEEARPGVEVPLVTLSPKREAARIARRLRDVFVEL